METMSNVLLAVGNAQKAGKAVKTDKIERVARMLEDLVLNNMFDQYGPEFCAKCILETLEEK